MTTSVLRRAARAAQAVGVEPRVLRELPGGNQNHVVRVGDGVRDVVVRFARDLGRLDGDPFEVEAWAARAAARAGIRTPAVVGRFDQDGVSVLVQELVRGNVVPADDVAAWRAVGSTLALLPAVDTSDAPDALFSRFGRDLGGAWGQHLAYNVELLHARDPLVALGVYDSRDRTRLVDLLAELADRPLAHGLVHGDLSHRNLIASPDGYVVLDWGSAHGGPTPWSDLERIRRWHAARDVETTVDDAAWEAVVEGMLGGVVPGGGGSGAPQVEAIASELAVLHALDVVRWALDRRPDRVAELALESARTIARELGSS